MAHIQVQSRNKESQCSDGSHSSAKPKQKEPMLRWLTFKCKAETKRANAQTERANAQMAHIQVQSRNKKSQCLDGSYSSAQSLNKKSYFAQTSHKMGPWRANDQVTHIQMQSRDKKSKCLDDSHSSTEPKQEKYYAQTSHIQAQNLNMKSKWSSDSNPSAKSGKHVNYVS